MKKFMVTKAYKRVPMDIPFSEACERNKEPILETLLEHIYPTDRRVLEIGAGTGQHAEYFASKFPQVEWYPTDLPANMLGLTKRFSQARIKNIQTAACCQATLFVTTLA